MPWGRHLGGVPISIMLCNITQNSMGQTPGGVPCQVQPGGYPARGDTQVGYPPSQVRMGGYPVRTTEGVLTTRRAVCLLRSRRRTFLFEYCLWLSHEKGTICQNVGHFKMFLLTKGRFIRLILLILLSSNSVFPLPNTETDTKTDQKWVVMGVHTAQRQKTTQIPIGFCVPVLSFCLGLGLWQCEWTIRGKN